MDGHRFDRFARLVATSSSRRAIVKAVAGGTLSLVSRRPLRHASAATAGIDYFALGDSIASGHGLMDEDGPPPAKCCVKDVDVCQTMPDCCQTCRRSQKAYPYKVRDLLKQSGYSVTRFSHLACTGAIAADNPTPGLPALKSLRHQVDEVLANLSDRPTLVTITVGANDFGWADPNNARYRFGEQDDNGFYDWVEETAGKATEALQREMERLTERPNVVVVYTDVFNPFNKQSWFFNPNVFISLLCGSRPLDHYQSCYGRAEYGLALLNIRYLAFANDHRDAAKQAGVPPRLAVAPVELRFVGHESPRGEGQLVGRRACCGNAEPDIRDTWIQHRYDDASNSRPCLGGEWKGDCFHPNEEGAKQIAMVVRDKALPLLATLTQPAVVPGGMWIEPGNNATVSGSTLHFAVHAYPTNPGDPAIEHVNFTMWWAGYGPRDEPWLIACVAYRPTHDDVYECTVDLSALGVAPGNVTISFDVYDVDGNRNLAPHGLRAISWSPQPITGCPNGQTRCGNACVDLRHDSYHCGDCSNQCGIFQTCCDGVCGCPQAMTIVPGACQPGEPIC